MRQPVFAHSPRDLWLVFLAILHAVLLVGGTLFAGASAAGTWTGHTVPLGACAIVCVYLTCTNYQCIAHNHIHNPLFSRPWMNRAFSVFNTFLLGGPQSLYRVHHLNHHKYNNAPCDRRPKDDRCPGDRSSTRRFARNPERDESLLLYALLGPIRVEFGWLYREAKRQGNARQVVLESVVFVLALAWLAFFAPGGFVTFFLPLWYLGQAAAFAENYAEHVGAPLGDRKRDSVSCYGRLYNFVWFNNGYHQEHHYRPQEHWSTVPRLRGELPPESERRVVPWFHPMALILRKSPSIPSKVGSTAA